VQSKANSLAAIVASLRTKLLLASAITCAFLLAGPQCCRAQSQSQHLNNASTQIVKAYRTLNFGDNTATVDRRLAEILEASPEDTRGEPNYSRETFWRSLFDTDAEYEPYKYDATRSTQSNNLESLMRYFRPLGIRVHTRGNSALYVSCYQLNDSTGRLVVVEVHYGPSDSGKLVEGFMQNYPNAQKMNKIYRFENAKYPGVSIEFERTFFSDINPDRRATLSIPTEKFAFSFTEPSKLSKEQLAVWDGLMAREGKPSQMSEYFESVKTSFLGFLKEVATSKPTRLRLDSLTYQGWYDNRQYESIIYGSPTAVFASKQILDPIMNSYHESVMSKDQKEKAKLKKESESSTSF